MTGLYALLLLIGVVLLLRFFCDTKEPFVVYGNSYYRPNCYQNVFGRTTCYPYNRSNCFRNIFGQKVCYPSGYGYPNYYYPYVRGDSTYIRRRPAYWGGTNRVHYWNRY